MHRSFLCRRRACSLAVLIGLMIATAAAGPALAALPTVPDGFKVRLVAAVPAVQYPCQVATAPDGSLFVGEDPMDQVGPADKPIDRILLFRDGKDPVVFADKLNAIFGMVWNDGALYVMNMPHLTVLRDSDGDGKADERKELFTDLGVPAGSPNNFNDHIVSGLKIGIDRHLYISVGDKGVPKATGPDGRTAQVVGGGVLRCRLDGTGLEVFSTGTRNHLEPNLDDRDNLFTYDNTDDGLGWWTRVTHHIDGGYYGYPFDYHTRTDRMLPRMAEYGGGSPCGGVFYGEDAWPEKYRGLVFWAEWGQRVVRAFRFEPAGSTFKVGDKIDFVEHGKVDDFRPLDLALSYDGKTMYIADWSMGGWGNKTEKLGRVYAVTYEGARPARARRRGKDSDPIAAQVRQLDHPSFNERFRAQMALTRQGKGSLPAVTSALANAGTAPVAKRHLIWVLGALAGGTPEENTALIGALMKSPNRDVRAQAARALGERAESAAVGPLVARLKDGEPSVKLQAVIALGRIGRAEAVPALLPLVAEKDTFVAFSARQALRRIGDWPATARGLVSPEPKVRTGTLLTMEQVYDAAASSRLAEFAVSTKRPVEERVKAIEYLGEVDRKAPPWNGKWWGTQPARRKPPARTIAWDATLWVMATIRELAASDSSPSIRTAAVESMARTGGEPRPFLRERFASEQDPGVKRAIALALGKLADTEALDLLTAVLRDARSPETVRDAAFEAVEMIGSKKAAVALADLLREKTLSAERQLRVVKALGRFKDGAAIKPLLATLKSSTATTTVRAAAIDALVAIVNNKKGPGRDNVAADVRALLTDPAADVRNRAIAAVGAVGDRQSIPTLIELAEKPESRFAAGMALAKLPDVRALQVYLRGLTDKNNGLRKASAAAIVNLRGPAAIVLDQLSKRNELSPAVLPELRTIFAGSAPVSTKTAPSDYAFLKAPGRDGFDPESYRAAALKGQGRANHGRQLFGDLQGLACVKCHAVGKDGGAVGPELSSVGAKYPRDELIASVLYPSAKISSGFEPTTFALVDGRVITGIVRAETETTVEIQDSEAKLVRVAKDQIDARKRSDISVMPNGLAQGLSPEDFADLIAYLETLKNVDTKSK